MAIVNNITPEEICKKLRPVFGKKIDQLYLQYRLAPDIQTKQEIERQMNILYEKYLNTTLLSDEIHLEPPKEEVISGQYPLGRVYYAKKEICTFGLNEEHFPRHICITGMSGSGKTNFAYQLIANLIIKKKPFIIFDWKKSFRPLSLVDKDLWIFTVGNNQVSNFFKININKPPRGVDPKEWVNMLCDLINESFFASYGVHKLLVETMDEAFQDFGVYDGSENYPTWYQIKDRLEEKAENSKRKSGRESEWMESALRIAHALTFGNFGEAINYKGEYEMSVEDLLKNRSLFELHSLNTAEKKFFCEFVLTYIYKLKKASDESSTEEFKSAIIVDEAHNIFLKDKPSFLKESVVDMVYREIREYGISLICLDQHISKLSDTVTGNSATHIAFQQILTQDVDCISSIMQLKERKKYFSMLNVGEAIVQQTGRYPNPFLIKVPYIKLKKEQVSDEDVKKDMKEKISTYRKNSIFKKQIEKERIEKKLQSLALAFTESGISPTDEFLKKQLALIEKMNNVIEKEKKDPSKSRITNHLQAEIEEQVKQSLLVGNDPKRIRKWLVSKGYNKSDINRAIKHVFENHKKLLEEKENETAQSI